MIADSTELNDLGQKRGCSGLLMTSSEELSGTIQADSELNNNTTSINEKGPTNNTEKLQTEANVGHVPELRSQIVTSQASSQAKEQRHEKIRQQNTAATILESEAVEATNEAGGCHTLRKNGNDNMGADGGRQKRLSKASDDADSSSGRHTNAMMKPLEELLEENDQRKFLKFRDRVVVRLKRLWHDLPSPQTDVNLLKNGIVKNTKRMRFETKTIELTDDDD